MLSIEKLSSKTWKILPYPGTSNGARDIVWDELTFLGAGTKHQREYFKQSVRELLEALVKRAESCNGQLSPLTVYSKVNRLWAFAEWLTQRGIWLMSDVREEDLVEYIADKVVCVQAKGRVPRAKTISSYVTFFRELFLVRKHYTSPIRFDPHCSIGLDSLVKKGSDLVPWKALPLEVAKSLILDALVWIKDIAPLLILLLQQIEMEVGCCVGLTKKQVTKRTASAFEKISHREEYKKIFDLLKDESKTTAEILRRAVRLTKGAVLVEILFLIGMRISEANSLDANNITYEVHEDGMQYRYVNGVAAKKKGLKRGWVAPEEVVTAIKALQDMNGPIATGREQVHLFQNIMGNGLRARVGTKIRPPSYTTLRNLLVDFARSSHRAEPYFGDLHPHRGRKTFARFVTLRDKRGLGALVQHYGHLYAAFLDGAYVGTDIELKEMLDEENRADLAEGLMDLLSSETLGGKGARALSQLRDSVEIELKFSGRVAIHAIVDRMIKQGVKLAPCDWGYCLYQQDVSACRGGPTGPNSINRSPSTCSSCQNFAVSEKYRGWWEQRYARDEDFLRNHDIPVQTSEFVNARLSEAGKILNDLTAKFVSVLD
ncbi:hypothetical protein ACHAC9_23600 [Massilia sp. CMS3.1]|uniref:hypothetical protein n=1 Tax=Massilia sp. CMS3.1 TaxID=3373083 RepID=UPI003EE6528A